MTQAEEKGKLFVGGLSWETTQASLLAYFSKFGEVKDCVVITNPATGKSRGFGFVTFKDPSCVETVQAAGPHILDGKQIDPNGCNRKKNPKTGKGGENSRKKLFVGGLPSNIDEAQLREGFSSYGKITDVVIVYDQQKQKPRGFGFLTFESEESVDKIVKERFVLLNGKQVECKRAEAKEAQANHEQTTGLMMFAQGIDGTIGLVPATAATHGMVYPSNAGGGIVTPAELAGAYKGLLPAETMQQTIPGLKYLTQQGSGHQYFLVGGSGGTGAGYYIQGGHAASAGAGGTYMVQGSGLSPSNPFGNVMMGGGAAQTNSVLVASPTGGSYIVHGNQVSGGSGGYFLSGGGGSGNAGILVQGAGGGGLHAGHYYMQYPGGTAMVQSPQTVDIGASLAGLGSTITGVQLPQTIYSLAKTEGQNGLSSESEKTTPNVVAAPYSVINPYAAALSLVGGASNEGTNEESGLRASSTNEVQTSSSVAQATPKVGYYIVPSYQATAQLQAGYGTAQYGSPLLAAGADPTQTTLIAAAPSLAHYGRISNHAAIAQGYHPYRR